MPRVALVAAIFPAGDQLLDQRAEIDRFELRAGQFGVGPGRFADVVDQPVEPADVVAGNIDQLLAKRGIIDPVESVDRRAQRRQRILELVGDVGGEGFDIVDPLAQRLAHVRDRAGEQADLVGPRGQARDIDLARATEPHAVRGERQPAQRPDDRPGEE